LTESAAATRKAPEGRGGTYPRSTSGLCVTIWLKEKVDVAQIPKSERIPKYLTVKIKGQDRPVRVITDVVSIGNSNINNDGADEAGDTWPTAGDVRPGARHTCSLKAVSSAGGEFGNDEAHIGSAGAIVEVGTSVYCTTAAHTIISVSHGQQDAPSHPRGFGVKDQKWRRIEPSAFFPGSIRVGPHIRDVFLLRVPDNFVASGEGIWPPDFHGRFATNQDIEAALHTDALTGFVWVERNRRRVKRPCSLWRGSDDFRREPHGHLLEYSFVWMYKFLSDKKRDTTKKGDSGAGVFIPAVNVNECRLLGLHFFRDGAIACAYRCAGGVRG